MSKVGKLHIQRKEGLASGRRPIWSYEQNPGDADLADHLLDRRPQVNLFRGERELLVRELRCLHGKSLPVYFAGKLTFCGV